MVTVVPASRVVPATGDCFHTRPARAGEPGGGSATTMIVIPRDCAVAAAVEYEAFCQAITFGGDDLREGLAAARERRAPRFGGR